MNRLGNCQNPYQGSFKRVLCVCSAGLLRSPTIAWVLSQEPYNCNTRACGVSKEYALILMDDVLLHWADKIICAGQEQLDCVPDADKHKAVSLNIPDSFGYRDSELVSIIKERLGFVSFD